MSNPTAAILLIGNELLSGRTQDANLKFIASSLGEMGIQVQEARVIPDHEETIITAVQTLREQYTYVFTTGGIGGTHDDITAACVAKAFGRRLVQNEIAFSILQTYYGDRLNTARARMALIPEGAALLDNPVSAAPGFRIENVFVLAGVPMVMQAMFDHAKSHLKPGTPILSQTVTCDLGEGTIADGLGDIQNRYLDIDIGSYPFFKDGKLGVSLVARGTDETQIAFVMAEISSLIESLGAVPIQD